MTLTESQQARHDRMLSEASRLAAEGGFDAVQMRSVATSADVALGTLYRYFPSKEHLLVSAMMRQIETLSNRVMVKPPAGSTSVDRVTEVLARANRSLQSQQNFTAAVVRSLASGDETVAPVVRQVRELMGTIILTAMTDVVPTDRQRLQAQLLQEIWLSALVAWISGVDDAGSVAAKLNAAAALLLESDR